jgi:hypothetical protein
MASERKPMTFNVAQPPAAVALAVGAERQQIGARVTRAVYRQLKARAALSGEPVQILVERAIGEFLAKPTS